MSSVFQHAIICQKINNSLLLAKMEEMDFMMEPETLRKPYRKYMKQIFRTLNLRH